MKIRYRLALFTVIIFLFYSKVSFSIEASEEYIKKAKQDILVLCLAYDGYIEKVEVRDDGKIFIVMKSGKKIIYDDGKKKSFEEKLANGDLQDMLEEPYSLEMIREVYEGNKDPGRIRVYSFFNEVYGKSENEVRSKLKVVETPFGNIKFNGVNNGGEALKKALTECYTYCKKDSRAYNYIAPTNGTFNYRVISGTGRLSAHSYGIAIDLNRNEHDYWKWTKKEAGTKRISNYPEEVVKIFEDNGFIWGGKWAHFDILHYEYRPEFILKAKMFGDIAKEEKHWFNGIEREGKIDYYINLIDEGFNKIN